VAALTEAKYGVVPRYSTISQYTYKELVNQSPKRIDPCGNLSNESYKLLCDAISMVIPIQQMKACARDDTHRKILAMLVKTMDVDMHKVVKLLDQLLCDTLQHIHGEKLNCAEDHCITWTTQNLKLRFDNWEKF
jgi:hypothetical protein